MCKAVHVPLLPHASPLTRAVSLMPLSPKLSYVAAPIHRIWSSLAASSSSPQSSKRLSLSYLLHFTSNTYLTPAIIQAHHSHIYHLICLIPATDASIVRSSTFSSFRRLYLQVVQETRRHTALKVSFPDMALYRALTRCEDLQLLTTASSQLSLPIFASTNTWSADCHTIASHFSWTWEVPNLIRDAEEADSAA